MNVLPSVGLNPFPFYMFLCIWREACTDTDFLTATEHSQLSRNKTVYRGQTARVPGGRWYLCPDESDHQSRQVGPDPEPVHREFPLEVFICSIVTRHTDSSRRWLTINDWRRRVRFLSPGFAGREEECERNSPFLLRAFLRMRRDCVQCTMQMPTAERADMV